MSFLRDLTSMRLFIFAFFLGTMPAGCVASMEQLAPYQQPQAKRAARWMVGHFVTLIVAEDDSASENLQRVVVPIWLDRRDGPWLYVEEAKVAQPDDPTSQFIMNIRLGFHGQIQCEIYDLPHDRAVHANAWNESDVLNSISPQQCDYRSGCTVDMHLYGQDVYVGSTSGGGCPDQYLNGSFMTIHQQIGALSMTRWVRGFTDDGELLWGSPDTPEVFNRLTKIPESLDEPLVMIQRSP